jgi:hypothetical protein
VVLKEAALRFICGMKKAGKARSIKKLPDKELTKLGNRIRELRLKKGFRNYEFFAYEHNIPRAQYGRYEKGEDLRYTSLLRVVRAFDISMEKFFSEGFD